jgi:hypothetical protein
MKRCGRTYFSAAFVSTLYPLPHSTSQPQTRSRCEWRLESFCSLFTKFLNSLGLLSLFLFPCFYLFVCVCVCVRAWPAHVLHHCKLLDKAYQANVCSHSGGKSRLHDQMGNKTTLEMQYLMWRHRLRSLHNPTNEHSFYYGVVRWACSSDHKGNDVFTE